MKTFTPPASVDFLIIGAGLAGLNAALELGKKGRVLLVSKGKLASGASAWAQGGIAVQGNKSDSALLHFKDTMAAGCGYNKEAAVKKLVNKSAEIVQKLLAMGIHFDQKGDNLAYSQEGGHSLPRIISNGDSTGRNICRAFWRKVRHHPQITLIENAFCLRLITDHTRCLGAEIVIGEKLTAIPALFTIIAGGGCGALYSRTTNPPEATGDPIALAVKAGLKLKDLEFIQFHPTAFQPTNKKAKSFLLSEVLRGEGAQLVNQNGQRYLLDKIPAAELAPRHLVSLHSFYEAQKGPIYLLFKNKTAAQLHRRFPDIYAKLSQVGLKLEKDPIPVSPAAHYQCGGIITDLHGRTNLDNCYAVGECARTGVHGANRLASNSLLETLVFSDAIATDITTAKIAKAALTLKNFSSGFFTKTKKRINKLSLKQIYFLRLLQNSIRILMWEKVGIARSIPNLQMAIQKLTVLQGQLQEWSKNKASASRLYWETENMLLAALAITKSARARTSSLGCHQLQDEA